MIRWVVDGISCFEWPWPNLGHCWRLSVVLFWTASFERSGRTNLQRPLSGRSVNFEISGGQRGKRPLFTVCMLAAVSCNYSLNSHGAISISKSLIK